MALLGIDLGGTKAAFAIFLEDGKMISHEKVVLKGLEGAGVGKLVTDQIGLHKAIALARHLSIDAIGVSVPGISYREKGTVWAPNIPDWEDYPLLTEINSAYPRMPVVIDNDRVCYISGELWQGNARGCRDAIYLSVGTGIGAGIITNGQYLRGAGGIAGAIGWMALSRPFKEIYTGCGCFENYASGNGMAKYATQLIEENGKYSGELKYKLGSITSYDVFKAYESNDIIATRVMENNIELWGMAVANLVSLFNPQKIIMGGGIFGPAIRFIPLIKEAASRWAQPISATQYSLESSALGQDAGLYGAAFLTLQNLLPGTLKNSDV